MSMVNQYTVFLIMFGIVNEVLSDTQLTYEKETSQLYSPNVTPSLGTGSCSDQDNVSPEFMHGVIASFSVTVFSELGDKTFFLAAILAMKQSRMQVFLGALAALAPMTVLSVVFGIAVSVVPKLLLKSVSSLLLALFGFKMLREGMSMTNEEGMQEYEKCKEDLKCKNKTHEVDKFYAMTQAFTLTMLGELGDRSQIAIILLATTENSYGVALGGVLGHILCTAAAVLGGRLLAQNIPVKRMTIIGGIVFLVFAITSWIS